MVAACRGLTTDGTYLEAGWTGIGEAGSGWARTPAIAGHDFDQAVVRQRMGGDAVAPGHRLGGDQGVDDRLLGRLDGRVEDGVDDDVADRPHVIGEEFRVVLVFRRESIPRRECDEQVSTGVPACAAGASQAQPRTLRDTFELIGEQRGVSRDDDDDRA